MKLLNKINRYFGSFHYSKYDLNQLSVLMGYQGKDLLVYFEICEDNYICSTTKRPINFKIFVVAMNLFFKTAIRQPTVFLKSLRWFHTIYFICGYLKLNKISSLVSFVDYNPLPKYIKKILDNKLITFGIQNSRRENRSSHFNFDNYLLLAPLKKNEQFSNHSCRKHDFGSLRLLLALNKNDRWNYIQKIPDTNEVPSNFILISSISKDFLNFINFNFKSKFSKQDFKLKLQELINKYDNSNYFREMRFINFLILCDYLADYTNKTKDKVAIINRSDTKFSEISLEKKFFENFPRFEFNRLTKIEKYDYILAKKNRIFVSDISTLSRECLSTNSKCIFFNYYVHYTGDYWTKNDAIFYSNKEEKKDFYLRLDKIKQLNKVDFINEKKKIRFGASIFPPNKKKLEEFLNMSNLKLRK